MYDDAIRETRLSAAAKAVTRRAVTRGMLGGGIVAAIMAVANQTEALAQGTPVSTDALPARYALKAGDLEIAFAPAVAGGKARLDYRDADTTVSFTGEDLSSEFSPALGRFVSVVIEHVDDGYVRYLTLLVPEVNRDENGLDVPVSTLAVITDHLTSIGGPRLVKGALQRYEVIELEGVAQFAT
jgi:hypothetical protein